MSERENIAMFTDCGQKNKKIKMSSNVASNLFRMDNWQIVILNWTGGSLWRVSKALGRRRIC